MKALLIQRGIVAYSVIEITTRPQKLPNGAWKHYPTNKVHYHCLVDSSLPEPRLRRIFNSSCVDSGLSTEDFEVHVKSIPDRKAFEHKAKYILKFDTYKDQAILFQPGTHINKTCSIGRWFINANGTKANKDVMWESIVSLFPKKEGVVKTGAAVGALSSLPFFNAPCVNPADAGERAVKMPKLSSREMFRLYGVSENLNEDGVYSLESFDDDAFNEDIYIDDLDETLNGWADATYGQGGRWCEITDDSFDSEGNISIEINGDDRLEIQDIIDKISTDSERSRFYVGVDAQLSEYRWVVAEPTGAVHSG